MTNKSPCTQICVLDGSICTGCGRTISEITSWSSLTDEEKDEILSEISQREF